MEQIGQGAEAKIWKDGNSVVKERFEKKYRHSVLDKKLRKSRTRREAKVMKKLSEMQIAVPQLFDMDEKDMKIKMEHLPGKTVKEVVDDLEKNKNRDGYSKLFFEIGQKVALMHNAGIIHHDLTTSNMIFQESKVFLIDFGLSFFSEKIEDKAVDLHLLKHAVESRHHKIVDECFDAVLQGYKEESNELAAVIKRYEQVEERGRNKTKY